MADNVKVNNVKHAWASIEAIDAGYGVMEEVQEISWELSRDNKLRHGRGSDPKGFALGNKEFSGQLVMSRDEYDDQFLPWVIGQGFEDPTDIPAFSLEIMRRRHAGDTLKTTRLLQVKFGGDQNGISQGATEWNVTLPFIYMGKEEIGIGG